jgi:hypothetical protein
MLQYQWLTLTQAQNALAARLADPSNIFWTLPELTLYLQESLRALNALTEQWNREFAFSVSPPQVWYNISQLSGSPRLRTVTDAYLYTIMQAHLLEPMTGAGVWTGTSQFSLSDLQFALQRRRDEIIQFAGCNLVDLPQVPSTPNVRRTYFPDSTLEPRRVRFVPDSGSAVTLTREDPEAWNAFEPQYLQQTGTPAAWSVIAGPPLAMDVDVPPNTAGAYDVIALQAGQTFAPPAATLIGVPDDWSWLAKMGAMADLLGRESEATDHLRADYFMQRYADMLQAMQNSNWLLTATINGITVDTPAVREMDGYSPEWQDNALAWPSLVTAGMDFCAPCPTGASGGVSAVVVGNAPIPVNPDDFVQVSRDAWDSVLSYAQFLASIKQGGSEFKDAMPLEKEFLSYCAATNKRLANLGLFRDVLGTEGKRQDRVQPR